MFNLNILQWLLVTIGVYPSRHRRLHHLPRLLFCVVDAACVVYTMYVCIFLALTREANNEQSDYYLHFAIGCDIIFCGLIYIWGFRWASRLEISRKTGHRSNGILGNTFPMNIYNSNISNKNDAWMWMNLIFSIGAIVLAAVETSRSTQYPTLQHEYSNEVAFLVYGFVYGVLLKLHCFAVYFAVASRLSDVSRRIEHLTSTLNASNVHTRCRIAVQMHLKVNDELGSFLKFAHLLYFAKLIIEAPAQSSAAQCDKFFYVFVSFLCNLQVFLVLLSRGDWLAESFNGLRAKVRHELVAKRSVELEVFYRSEFGIFIGSSSGGPICWKNNFAFIGFVWSFTFIIVQLGMAIMPVECK